MRKGIVQAWGNPAAVIYPRSSCKMLQALPLLESGAGRGWTTGASGAVLRLASGVGDACLDGARAG
jgi:L-asparaginase II